MGTPDFAVPSLDILVKNNYDVVGVITATDKYGGRGNKKLLQSAVKKYAVAHNIKVLQPKNLKSPEFLEELKALKADLQIVVAFRMLPEVVWNMPPMGTFNLHASLLPKYRGAAPINWAVIRGEKETGATTFFLKHEIDTGDIIDQCRIPIHPEDNAGQVHDRLMDAGAQLVLKSVQQIEKGPVELIPQDASKATKAPKIFAETCEIDLSQSVEEVYNFIRGMSPYPTAWTTFRGKKLKIFKTQPFQIETPSKGLNDPLVIQNSKEMRLYAKDGYLNLLEVQLEGKKRMDIASFLNGLR